MKRLILVASMFMATTAFADSRVGRDEIAFCQAIGDFAEQTMQRRQNNVPISGQLLAIYDDVKGDEQLSTLLEYIVYDAYDMIVFLSDYGKERAVAEFRDNVEFSCITNVSFD